MITGDHPLTARAIARDIGILKKGIVLTSEDLNSLSSRDRQKAVLEAEVFARVEPTHKLEIVKAVQVF